MHIFRKTRGRHMDAGLVLINRVGHVRQAPFGPHRRDQLHEGRLPFIDHGTVEILEQGRLGQHIAQTCDRVPANRDVDMGEMLLDQGAEGHGGEHLLLQDDRDADYVRLRCFDGRLHQLLEHVPIDIHLGIVHRVHHFGGDEDFIGEVRLHRRHADPRRGIDHRNNRRDLAEDLNGQL